jgi:hypothetical protein
MIQAKNSVPVLFGLVQGKIDGIEVEAPLSLVRGEAMTLNFQVTGEGASNLKSVVRVNVFDPDGENALYYSDNCEVINGSGIHRFNTALNDQPGQWKIELTEVISGTKNEVTVELQ